MRVKWVSPTTDLAKWLGTEVDALLMGASKMTSPLLPGWLLTFHVERGRFVTTLVVTATPDPF